MNYMDMFRLYAYFIINIYQRGGIMAYEKDHDDVMYENYICMYCGWWICPIIDGVTDCGCEEE
tara:strand:- start:1992 stop:2180 length:189 start_codon:yes stop_codon:yes gene_type:complete